MEKTVWIEVEVDGLLGGVRRQKGKEVSLPCKGIGSIESWERLYSAIRDLSAEFGLLFPSSDVGCPSSDAVLRSVPLDQGEKVGPPYILDLSCVHEWRETSEDSGVFRPTERGEKEDVVSIWHIEFAVECEFDARLWWDFCEGGGYPSHHVSRAWEVETTDFNLFKAASDCAVAAALWASVDGSEVRMAELNGQIYLDPTRALVRDRSGAVWLKASDFGGDRTFALVNSYILRAKGVETDERIEDGVISIEATDAAIRGWIRELWDYPVLCETEFARIEQVVLAENMFDRDFGCEWVLRQIAQATGLSFAAVKEAVKKSGRDPIEVVDHEGLSLSQHGSLRISGWWVDCERAIEFCREIGLEG